ncbi:hypothetical protein LCGC14_0236100 [marine sediment metagenome]|uniref:Uncharacterized protein n=1 Tax=marine sediment metagenome TaxID=412755 RepID=A0A0F9UDP7_9ZZZZ
MCVYMMSEKQTKKCPICDGLGVKLIENPTSTERRDCILGDVCPDCFGKGRICMADLPSTPELNIRFEGGVDGG